VQHTTYDEANKTRDKIKIDYTQYIRCSKLKDYIAKIQDSVSNIFDLSVYIL